MDSQTTCTECGCKLPADAAEGLCPRCLLALGLKEVVTAPQLSIRCPNCHIRIEVVDDSPMLEVTCPSCDSRFSLAGEPTMSFGHARPKQLGKFELTECVGTGGFGSVWKAFDPELQRVVAIKIPRQGVLSPAESEQFLREARVTALLRHPNIVPVHEIGRLDGQLYIVSEFIDGITLADYLSSERVTIRTAVQLCATITEAVQHAHQQGVIHRDLKPSNILLERDRSALTIRDFDAASPSTEREQRIPAVGLVPHVTDFGLARRLAGEVTITMDGRILGTPAYMAPEQARGEGHQADARSDVYSLGVILFELLTGEKPFRGTSRMLLDQVLHEDAPSPRKFNGSIPRDLETICLKCLEKEPSRRYSTARLLCDELRRFLHGEPIEARPISKVQRAWRWCHRNPVVASLITAVAATLMTGLATTWWQWRVAESERDTSEQRRQAVTTALDESRGRLARLFVERGVQAIESNPHTGLPWLVEALKTESPSSHRIHAHRLRLALMLGQVPKLVQFWPGARDAKLSSDGSQIAIAVGSQVFLHRLPSMEQVGILNHALPVIEVHYSPSSDRLITLTRNQQQTAPRSDQFIMARVWDPQNAKPLSDSKRIDDPAFFGRGGPPDLVFAPDAKRLVVVNHHMLNRHYVRMTVHVFDALTLNLLSNKFAFHHNDEYLDYRLSPDATRIFTLQGVPYTGKGEREETWDKNRGRPQLWEIETAEPIFPPFEPALDYTSYAVYSPDGKLIAAYHDKKVSLWDAQTGSLLRELKSEGHRLSFSNDSKSLFIAGNSKTEWRDISNGELKEEWDHDGPFTIHPGGDWVAWNDEANGRSFVQNIRNQDREPAMLPNHRSISFSPDGSRLVFHPSGHFQSGEYQLPKAVEVRRTKDGYPLTPPLRFSGSLSADARYYLSVDDRNEIGVWLWDLDFKPSVARPFLQNDTPLRDAAFSNDHRTIVTLSHDQSVNVWDANSGKQQPKSIALKGDWRWLQISPDTNTVAVVGNGLNPPRQPDDGDHEQEGANWRDSRQIQLLDLMTCKRIGPVLSFPHGIERVLFSPDSRRLIVTEIVDRQTDLDGDSDGKFKVIRNDHTELHVIDARNGTSSQPTSSLPLSAVPIEFSADGKSLLIMRMDETGTGMDQVGLGQHGAAMMWSLETTEPITPFLAPTRGDLFSAALSPDNSRIVLGSTDGVSEIWDSKTGMRLVGDLVQTSGAVDRIFFLPDGQSFVTVSEADSIYSTFEMRRWSTKDGAPLSAPVMEPRLRFAATGVSDDARLAVVADSYRLRLWDFETGLKLSAAIPLESQDDYPRQARRHPQLEAEFSEDGRRLYVETKEFLYMVPVGKMLDDLPADETLQAWAELLSGHRLDSAGAFVPMTAEDHRRAWAVVFESGAIP